MFTFRKNTSCPSSQELLAFQNDELAAEDHQEIEVHLKVCEFCEAEVEFYSNYPQSDELVMTSAEIPLPLYELAEALLSNKLKDPLTLNTLFDEDEEVLVKKA